MVGELLDNVTSFDGLMEFPNLVTGGWYWTTSVLILFFILFFAFNKRFSTKASAIGSAFVCTLTSVFFAFANLINFSLFAQLLIILCVSMIVFYDSVAK